MPASVFIDSTTHSNCILIKNKLYDNDTFYPYPKNGLLYSVSVNTQSVQLFQYGGSIIVEYLFFDYWNLDGVTAFDFETLIDYMAANFYAVGSGGGGGGDATAALQIAGNAILTPIESNTSAAVPILTDIQQNTYDTVGAVGSIVTPINDIQFNTESTALISVTMNTSLDNIENYTSQLKGSLFPVSTVSIAASGTGLVGSGKMVLAAVWADTGLPMTAAEIEIMSGVNSAIVLNAEKLLLCNSAFALAANYTNFVGIGSSRTWTNPSGSTGIVLFTGQAH